MSYALVGSHGSVATASGGSAVTPAYGQSPTANNLLICWCVGRASQTMPTTPAGWTVLLQHANGAGSGSTATIFGKIAAGGDGAPTIAALSGVTWYAMLAEFSGGPTTLTGIVDQTAFAGGTTSPLTTTAAAADAASGEMVLAADLITHSPAAAASNSPLLNNGSLVHVTNSGTSAVGTYGFGYAVSTTSNSSADSNAWTFTTTPNSGVAIMLSLKVTVGTTYNDSQSGTLTLAGATTEAYTGADSPTGDLILSGGAATESAAFTNTAAGTLLFSGTGSDSETHGTATAVIQDFAVRSTHGRARLVDSTED